MNVDVIAFDSHEKLEDMMVLSGVFDVPLKTSVIKMALDKYLLSKMSGNHKVKNVSEVSGSNKKPFRQKGTGNARQGNIRSPILRGGGVSHGPVVRSHLIDLPKKVQAFALKSAISYKYSKGYVRFFKNYDLNSYKTKDLLRSLLTYADHSICFVLPNFKEDKNLLLASRSLRNIKTTGYLSLNIFDILKYEYIFFSQKALELFIARFSK